MYQFLFKLLSEVIPTIKYNASNQTSISFQLKRKKITFSKLNEHYNLSNTLSKLNITIITSSKNVTELIFLLKSFNFNIQN